MNNNRMSELEKSQQGGQQRQPGQQRQSGQQQHQQRQSDEQRKSGEPGRKEDEFDQTDIPGIDVDDEDEDRDLISDDSRDEDIPQR